MIVTLDGQTAIVTGRRRGSRRGLRPGPRRRRGGRRGQRRVRRGAAATVAAIEQAGGRATAVVAPVGCSEAAKQLVDTAISTFGGLDILVTNAGILRDKSLLKMTDDDFDQVIDVHLRGTFTCVRAAYASFKERGSPAGSSRSARRRASAAPSVRPTTPPRRRGSSGWCAPGLSRCSVPGSWSTRSSRWRRRR